MHSSPLFLLFIFCFHLFILLRVPFNHELETTFNNVLKHFLPFLYFSSCFSFIMLCNRVTSWVDKFSNFMGQLLTLTSFPGRRILLLMSVPHLQWWAPTLGHLQVYLKQWERLVLNCNFLLDHVLHNWGILLGCLMNSSVVQLPARVALTGEVEALSDEKVNLVNFWMMCRND